MACGRHSGFTGCAAYAAGMVSSMHPSSPGRPVNGATSPPELLTLHALRLTGWPSTDAVAAWAALERALVGELLEDDEARGFVQRSTYGGRSGWSLTDRGRVEDERRLADELARTGARNAVERAHERFLPPDEREVPGCLHAVADPANRS